MILKDNCIGCQACADICPVSAIAFEYNTWGEGRAIADGEKCINCGKCDAICPALHATFYDAVSSVYAVKSMKHSNTGSSGGVFYELAKSFIENGGLVYGAAFNKELKLVHVGTGNASELIKLCKSKYIHSDMSGIYKEMGEFLKNGRMVMFVGTPCQTTAVRNLFENKYDGQLVLVDFLCHGTGTQKVFDLCVKDAEIRLQGKITDFLFRAKSRKAEHSFTYTLLKKGKERKRSGYGFEFPYYYAYLKYVIFDDACYKCQFSRNQRVGDITLGDFWGIQAYHKGLKDYQGVSMISLNTEKGKMLFGKVKEKCVVYEYPLNCATAKNQSFSEPEKYPKEKLELVEILEKQGGQALVQKLTCQKVKKGIIYAKIPQWVKKAYHFIRGRK